MSKSLAARIQKQFKQLNALIIVVGVLMLVFLGVAFYLIFKVLGLETNSNAWIIALIFSAVTLLVTVGIIYFIVDKYHVRVRNNVMQVVASEIRQLRAANKRAESLQAMAAVMRGTLSFERVVEEALDVCSLAIEEMGVPKQSLVGGVFLYRGSTLYPVATRRFHSKDENRVLKGENGVISDAFADAETAVTDNPRQDPELRGFIAFQNCLTAACIPLRAGFQIFGAIIIGSTTAVKFDKDHFELFNAVADQAVIALQNAELYEKLEAEKQRMIEADEEARKELSRDLHDGPTQTIAAIAMRVNFIRSLITRDPEQAMGELAKVEELAKQTSKEVRALLFKLRPLVLETQGLAAAIEQVLSRYKENDGINGRLVGGENADLITDSAQTVIFAICEEALNNARKYSQADLLEVRFWKEDDLFVVVVRDDGVGFDAEAVNKNYSSRGSLGMINMRERAERIDGSLRLESKPGQGTSITLVVPLEKHGRNI